MIIHFNKKIILWIINFILIFLTILISLSIVCAAVYFPLIWIGAANIAKGWTIAIGIFYMVITIIRIIVEATS
jgi:hypothetical protein